jgi:hypothetical protein
MPLTLAPYTTKRAFDAAIRERFVSLPPFDSYLPFNQTEGNLQVNGKVSAS